MCQAYDGEREMLVRTELHEIRQKYEAYKRGEIELTREELLKLAIEKMMLEER